MKHFFYLHRRYLLALVICITHSLSALRTLHTLEKVFISPYAFEQCADAVFDTERQSQFLPNSVRPGSIVAIRGRDIPHFFKKYHPHIKHPYIIITFGEYRDAFDPSYLPYLLDKKVIAWFGVHPHPIAYKKFTALPLGIKVKRADAHKLKKIQALFLKLRKRPKKNLVYLNFAQNHPQRRLVKKLLMDKPFCTVSQRVTKKERVSFERYLSEMASCAFTVSPPGHAPDSYRTWESIMVGSIPIVERSHLDGLYTDLPIIVVDDWQEITQEFLDQKLQELSAKRYNLEKMFMRFWLGKIEAARKDFKRMRRLHDLR